jgi:hypothetical protein
MLFLCTFAFNYVVQYVSAQATQYYCEICHFARGSGRVPMFSDNENACTTIAVVLSLEKKWDPYWTKEQYKDHNTH